MEQAARLIQQAWRPAGDMVVIHTVNTGQRLLWDRPWHILDTLESTLRYDLEIMTQREGEKLPAYVHALGAYPIHTCNSRLQPGVVLNAELGPIVIEADTIIGAHSVIEGPCHVGTHTQLAAHTYLRPNTVIGPPASSPGSVISLYKGFPTKHTWVIWGTLW
ncbi:MAG: hypothetical protein HC898_12065 [Phycisphaerales bacterium]|nr:hypothetical protein [Phycisphaerales bacterium]